MASEVNMTDHLTSRARMGAVVRLLGVAGLSMLAAGAAQACPCEPISPAQGFERAEYVFIGKVVEATQHTWTVDVDRVWKGADKLAGRVRLLDVYAGIDCGFYFEAERSYVFFAIVAKSGRYVYYQPQVCNWTSEVHAKRVADADGSPWLEDFIAKSYGPGEPPKAVDPWERLREESGALN
jgi:hypothetical protein